MRLHLPSLILAVLCQANALLGQNAKIDSLKSLLLEESSDSAQAYLYNELGYNYLVYVSIDSAKPYLSEAKKYSAKSESKDAMASVFKNFAYLYLDLGDYDSSLRYSKDAEVLFESVNNRSQVASSLRIQGISYLNQGKFDSAKVLLDKALLKYEAEENMLGKMLVYQHYGDLFITTGNYLRGFEFLMGALDISKGLQNKDAEVSILGNLGNLYEEIGQYEKAIKLFSTYRQQCLQNNDLMGEAVALVNIGHLQNKIGEFSVSANNSRKALKITRSSNSVVTLVSILTNLGESYLSMGKLDSALAYYRESLPLTLKIQDPELIIPNWIGLGNFHRVNSNLDSADYYLQKSLTDARKFGLPHEEMKTLDLLYRIYEGGKDTNLSFRYFKMFSLLKDSLIGQRTARALAIAEKDAEFRMEKRNREEQMRLQNLAKREQLENAVLIRNGSVLVAVLSLIIVLMLFRAYKKDQKVKAQLAVLNADLVTANEKILEINVGLEEKVKMRTILLQQKNAALTEYLQSNSHIVRAPLARILGLISLFKDSDRDQLDLDFFVENVDRSAEELDQVLRNINDTLSKVQT
ncbi:MAG: tetratricopeptide repeat protein [Bacteroidota bacterium]